MRSSTLHRWGPTASMMLVSLISYVDRNTLALLAPTLLSELHLSAAQYGWMISSFSVAYTVGNPLWGAALDRLGLRLGMFLAVALWTVASASHALATSFAGFALARAVLGFGEGATFPGGLRATQALPVAQRSRGMAVAYSGGSLGAILTPLLVTPIAVAYGWRAAFLCTGLAGALWLALWLPMSRALPPAATADPRDQDRVHPGEPRLGAFVATYAFGALPLGFVLYGAPLYLHGALGLSQRALGRLLWIPPLGWEVGYFFWGWVMDRVLRNRGGAERTASAYTVLFACLTLLSLPLAATRELTDVGLVLAAFFLATFAAAGFVIVSLTYASRVFSARDAGLIAGTGAGSWSLVVAVLMPLFGRMFDRQAYGSAFAIAATTPVLGFTVWAAIHRPMTTAPSR